MRMDLHEENGHWIYCMPIDTTQWFGFTYKIFEMDTGREYIGKKQFGSITRKKVPGRVNRKVIRSESKWREYTGSSTELNEQIKLKGKANYLFVILQLHKTKGDMHYEEVRLQVFEDALRCKLPNGTKKYYNKMINSVKFIPN